MGVTGQRGLDRGDTVDRRDLVGERGIDRLAGVVGVELLDAAHLEVGIPRELIEQLVERRREAVGEDERTDDERDAGGDGDRDGDRAAEA